MKIGFSQRLTAMLMVLIMIFTMTPTSIIAEELHDHEAEAASVIEVAALSVSASASADFVYAGEEGVTVTAKIAGGLAPYEVTLQAVKDGSVVSTQSTVTEGTSAKLSFAPTSYGDYELVVTVHDAAHTQDLTSVSLAVAEHDTENEAAWAASVSGASISGDWGKSILSVAKTQVGYAESAKDFVLKSGAKQGYSRYGAWYGTPYAAWNISFLAFAAEYAQVPNDALLSGSSYRSWVNGMSNKGAYMTSGYTPVAGDIAFLSGSRVAVVESVSGANVTVIEGDVNGTVARKTYAISKVAGFGNTGLMQGLYNGTATAVPTAAPDATQAPEATDKPAATALPTAAPVATPVPEEEELTFEATPTPGPGVNTAPKDDNDPLSGMMGTMGDLVGELDAAATAIPAQFSEAYYLMQAEIRALMEKYLGTANPTKAEIEAFVEGLELQEMYYILLEFDELSEFAQSIAISDYEGVAVFENEAAFNVFRNATEKKFEALTVQRATLYPVDGVTVTNVSDKGTSGLYKKEEHSLYQSGYSDITITNSADYKATIEFDYTVTVDDNAKGAYIKFSETTEYYTLNNGASSQTFTGTRKSYLLDAGASITVRIYTGTNSYKTGWIEIYLKNFTHVKAKENPKVTFAFDSSLGAVTANGVGVANGGSLEYDSSSAMALVATPNSNIKFAGWVNEATNVVLSTSASFAFTPAEDVTVKALFSKDIAMWYHKEQNKLYENLNLALTAVGSSGTLVLACDGTLPSGTYTIPSGVTVLIPRDAAYTVNTTTPYTPEATYVQPTAFRTLTMANGANLVVNGALCVNGTMSAAGGTQGHPTGTVGFIRMQEGSDIVIENGGTLYAWGYIVGTGDVQVEAKSGATVYETFQVMDWRGGDVSSQLATGKIVFPMSQYYVQNIEVPLKLNAGATESCYFAVTIGLIGVQGASLPFFGGDNALFGLSSGYAIKDYREGTGRLLVEGHGAFSVKGISISMRLGALGTTNINSGEFELPINGMMDIEMVSGTLTIGQDIALLPGAKIKVYENAKCVFSDNASAYLISWKDWNTGEYVTGDNKGTINSDTNYVYNRRKYTPLNYAPGGTGSDGRTEDAAIVINGTVDASAGYVYTSMNATPPVTSTGTGTVVVRAGDPVKKIQQLEQVGDDGKTLIYYYLPFEPAKLKNADGTYTNTKTGSLIVNGVEQTVTYYEVTGVTGDAESGYSFAAAQIDVCDGTYKYDKTNNGGTWEYACAEDKTRHVATRREQPITCVEPYKAFYTCECGTLVDTENTGETLAPLGHDYKDAEGNYVPEQGVSVSATCIEAGYTLYTCTRCSENTEDHTEKVVNPEAPALGHDYDADGDGVDDGVVTPPKCTTDGYTIYTCTRENCEDTTEGHTETVNGDPATGHKAAENAATCVPWVCSVCSETEREKLTAHIRGEAVTENVVDATCTNGGSYDTVTYCSACVTHVIERKPETTPALGHTFDPNYTGSIDSIIETKAATCLVDGYTKTICGVEGCDESLLSTQEAPGHSYDTANFVKVDANCKAPGYVVFTCTVCADKAEEDREEGYQLTIDADTDLNSLSQTMRDFVTYSGKVNLADLKKKDHTPEIITAQAPTCTEDGMTAGVKCSVCDAVTEEPQVDPATGHKYVAVAEKADPATCENPGMLVFKCENSCQDEVTVEYTKGGYAELDDEIQKVLTGEAYNLLAPTGHTYVATYQAPTCEDAGFFTFICACDAEKKITVATTAEELTALLAETEIADAVAERFTIGEFAPAKDLAAKDHTPGTPAIENETPATCMEGGSYDEVVYCTVCKTEDGKATEISRVTKIVAANGHSYGTAQVVAATCTTDGTITFTCTVCTETATEASEGIVVIRHSTNVETDLNDQAKAAYEAYVTANEGFALTQLQAYGHDYEFVSKVDASCNQAGSITYTCQNGENCTAVVVKYEDDTTNYDALFASYNADIQTHLQDNYIGEMSMTEFFKTLENWGDHEQVTVKDPATCKHPTKVTYTCSKNCGYGYEETLNDQLPHAYSVKIVSESESCTAVRKINVSCPNGCGVDETFTAAQFRAGEVKLPEAAAALVTDDVLAQAEQVAHVFGTGEGEVLWKEQTCTEPGEDIFACKKCGTTVSVTYNTRYEDLHPTIQQYYDEAWLQWGFTWEDVMASFAPDGHEFNQGEPGETATCEHEGTYIYTCVRGCTYTFAPSTYSAETVPEELKDVVDETLLSGLRQKEHVYTVSVAQNPTCTEQGKLKVACGLGCNYISDPFTPAEFEVGTVSLPEGAETAVTEYGFDAVLAVDHAWKESGRQQPTCMADGSITYVCEHDAKHTYTLAPSTYAETEAPDELKAIFAAVLTEVQATGHNYDENETLAELPTCTESGKRVFVCQNSCKGTVEVTYIEGDFANLDATITDELNEEAYSDLQPTGHNYDWTDGEAKGTVTTESTCLAEGYITKTCNQCENGEGHVVIVRYDANSTDEDILALAIKPHNFKDNVVTADATCAAEGSMTFTCTNGCGSTYVVKPSNYEELPAEAKDLVTATELQDLQLQDHNYTWVDEANGTKGTETVYPTCEGPGYIVKTCNQCANTVAGHQIRIDYVEGDESDANKVLAPLGHKYTSEVTTLPTCTKEGVRTYTCQNDNGHTYTEAVAAKGHTYGKPVKVERNCTVDGTITFTCTVCTAEAAEPDRVVVITYNTNVDTDLNDQAKAAFAKAYPDFDLTTLEHTGHNYKDTVTLPTCTEKGYTTHTCQNEHANGACTDRYVDTYVEPTGHNFDYEGGVTTKVAVSCTTDGELLLDCKECDFTFPVTVNTPKENLTDAMKAVLGSDYDPATALAKWNHSNVTNHPAETAKCTGYLSAGTYCNLCNSWIVERVTLVGDHVYNTNQNATGSVYTDPTCVEDGYWTYKCFWCDKTNDEVVKDSKTNHAGKVYHEQKDATCTAEGYTEGYFCQACAERTGNGWIEGHTVITATGHTFTADPHEPSCEVEGYIVYTCVKGCTYTLKPSTYAADKAAGEVPAEVETQVNDELMNSLAALAHNWSEETTPATCTKDSFTVKKCLTVGGCGDEQTTIHENTKLGHKWSAWTDDPANTATCTKAGKEIRNCQSENCDGINATEIRDKNALGHDWSEWAEDPDHKATCIETGTEVRRCQSVNCDGIDATETRVKDELGHKWLGAQRTEPTCVTDGESIGNVCERCGTETEHEILPALGHNYKVGDNWVEDRCTQDVKPTCTEAGYKVYTCTREGCTETTQGHVSEQVPVAKLGHEWTSAKTDPDCDNDGQIVYTCVRGCTYTLTVDYDAAQVPEGIEVNDTLIESITALNHMNADATEAVAPTCTQVGYTAGKFCPDCDEYIDGHSEVAANGHTWTSKTTKPTCTAPGFITYTCTVDGCDGEYIIYHNTDLETVELPKNLTVTSEEVTALAQLDHKIETKVTDPTCFEDGFTEKWCPVTGEGACNYYEKITNTGSMRKHNMVATETVVTADCVTKTDGYTLYECDQPGCDHTAPDDFVLWDSDEVHTYNVTAADCDTPRYCTKCQTADNPTDPALGHDETGAAATCLQPQVCARPGCSKVLVKALGHEYLEAEENATCIDRECQRCHETIKGDGQHAFEDADATCVDRACTLCGNTIKGDGQHAFEDADATCIDRKCVLCELTYEATTSHDYEDDDATCVDRTCLLCGGEAKATTEHDYEVVIVESTCVTEGTKTETCKLCGDVVTTTLDLKKEHTYSDDEDAWIATDEPTCQQTGSKYRECTVEGCNVRDTVEIPVVPCVYNETYTAATCGKDGFTTYTCKWCGDTYTETSETDKATGEHSFEDADATCIDRVCTQCGNTIEGDGKHDYEDDDATCIDRTCLLCGTEAKATTDHDYDVVIVDSTCVTQGTKTETCKLCGDVVTTTLDLKTEHTYSDAEDAWIVTDEPTCQQTGSKYRECTVEGCNVRDTVEIPVVPCVYNETYTAATCGKDGFTTYTCKWCNDTYTETSETDKATGEHQYEEEIVRDSTCAEVGEKKFTCSVCGDSYTAEIAKKDHNYKQTGSTPKSCTEHGVLTFTCQNNCGGDTGVVNVTYNANYQMYYRSLDSGIQKLLKNPIAIRSLMASHTDTSTVVEPTCTAKGYTEKKCSVCGRIEKTNETAMKDHTYTSETTKPSTCKDHGVKTYTCTVCPYSYTEELPLDPVHKYVTLNQKPTCTEIGYTGGQRCSVCGVDSTAYPPQIAPATGHDYSCVYTAPACMADGTFVFTCQNGTCGDKQEITVNTTAEELAELMKEDEIAVAVKQYFGEDFDPAKDLLALDHDIIIDEAQAPTCTEDGLKAGQHCSRCDAETVEQEIDPKLGHAFSANEDGKDCLDGRVCTRCNQAIAATAEHKWNAGEVTTAPTCTAEGEKTFTCTVCGGTYTESVKKAEHSYNAVVTAPTCLANGFTTFTCTVCSDTYTDNIVTTTGHAWGEPVVVPNTCGKDGYTSKTCSACGEVETYDETLATGNHTYGDWTVSLEPTCEDEGEKQHTCTVCGNVETAVVEKKAHLDDVPIPAVPPTCDSYGWTAGVKCSACDQITVQPQYDPQLTHIWVAYEYQAPTCDEPGNRNDGSYCSLCNKEATPATVIPAINHKNQYAGEAKEPTCTEAGWTAGIYCPDCNTWREPREELEPIGHKNQHPGEAKEPTCTEAGWTAGVYCPDCETWREHQEDLKPTDHENQHPGEAKDPTCTEPGNTAGIYCPDCENWLEPQEDLQPTGHDMSEWVETTPHTCTEAGEETRYCLNECGLKEKQPTDAAHTPEPIPAVSHTCTEDGLTEGSKCAVCGDILVEQKVDPAAHAWETVTLHKDATCTEDGSRDVRCTECGATDTIVIPATGHTEVIDPAVAAVCKTDGSLIDGLTEGMHCSVCEEVLVAQEVVKAAHRWSIAPCTNVNAICIRCGYTNGSELLQHNMAPATCTKPATCTYTGCGYTDGEALGHKLVDIDEIPVTCEEDGWTAGVQCTVCGVYTERPVKIPAYDHKYQTDEGEISAIATYPAKNPTYTSEGWYEYEACSRCTYSTKVIREKLPEPSIDTFEEFIKYLPKLEEWAVEYSKKTPGTDPVALVIKYIRTGVDRYNSGSWGIMAGYEDKGFAEYVIQQEDAYNSQFTEEQQDQMLQVSGFKDMKEFYLPNNNFVDFGHMFGTMDITYTNKGSQNHADVGGWAGDLVDLLSTSDHESHQDLINSVGDDFEALVDIIRTDLLGYDFDHEDTFALNDIYGDLDAFYIMENLDADGYAGGDMTKLFNSYFDGSLSAVTRADYLLANRFDDVRTRSAIREAVYTEYTTNAMISTLEGTRDFKNTDDLITRRKAVCYAFADYLCILAGDWVNDTDNPYLTDYESSYSMLAPGISMEIHKATSADNKNMVYYLGYADLAREDVDVMINYHDRYVDEGWNMSRVLDQANKAADKYYANPESEHYIENFAPVVAVNGAGFDMGTGEPSGLLVMHGEEYHGINSNGFFGITKSGKAIIGTTAEYNSTYKGELAEGIAGFGTMLVVNGELAKNIPTTNYYSDRASRTAVGITATGRVVFMVLDGRQEPWSCGGSMIEIAQIMKLAGCVTAINMDGGGSTTFVARRAGDEELSLVNRPSDGVQRSVSTSMMMVSTAPSSKTFDRALVESNYNFMTVGAEVSVTSTGLSATNNIVALPEGAYWAVSDPEMAEIVDTGDVVINKEDPTVTKKTAKVTAKKNGEFEVYLMLDDVIIGQKTLNVIVPDQIYFTREKIDGVYGYGVELPLKARYEGKEAAFVPEDIAFTISNPAVGEMDGLTFNVAEESTVKTVTVTAALKLNAEVTASINVVLYKDGENNFNFDNATGGSRELAWLREVSNAKQEGTSTYYIIDPKEDMVTSYTVALDMSQIPIPEALEDLTYMLPGSDLEGASAWTFLLQLAERISELTTVTAEFTLDPNFALVGYDEETGEYDASNLTLINEYFVLNKEAPVVYNPAENTLTLKLNWKGFSQAIDPETANPMCIVSGLKLIPKDDAAWDAKDRLVAVHAADVGYKVYMRANALHTFASKPENQKTFGLYPYGPYTNSRGIVENGGWFASTYATFKDTYTLIKSLKNGWVVEEGGFRYYVDGQYLIGVHLIADDGLYYQFDKNGINIGQTPYTGMHVMNDKTYYMQNGVPFKDWITLDDGYWYRFDPKTGAGTHGSYTTTFTHTNEDGTTSTNNVVYEFENGKLLDGVWYNDGIGWRYYYGPYYYKQGWRELTTQEGQKNGTGEKAMFFFEAYYAQQNVSPVQEAHAIYEYWYEFTDEGAMVRNAPSGLYWWDDDWYKGKNGTIEPELYYVDENHPEGNGYSLAVTDGLHLIDGDYYYFDLWTGQAFRNKSEWVDVTNGLLPQGTYRFGADGKIIMKTGVFDENGTLYYYLNGKRTANAGLVEYEGNIYGVGSGAICAVNQSAYINKDNGLAAGIGTYRFDANGHLIAEKAVVDEAGTLYYYNEAGKRVANAGLVEYAGDIYYIGLYTADGVEVNKNTAIAAVDVEIDVPKNKTNGLLPAGTYRFDENGKAILTTELVEGDDGKLYYYMNGALQKDAGLIKYEDAYYYIDANGAAVTNTEMLVEKTIAPFPVDTYEFGEDGKMIIREGIYEGYYYVGGIKTAAGLVEEDGKYYFAAEGGKIVTDTKYDVQKTNDLLPAGIYRIGEDGALNLATELTDEDGKLVYYYEGKLAVNAGLIQIDGDYYYIGEDGTALTDAKQKITTNNGLELALGTYRFGEDGKAILTTELVEEADGKLYYYDKGRMADKAALIEYEGDYYWVEVNGFVVTSTKISLGNGEKLPTGIYRVGEDGKIILTTELVNENGHLTYYKNGILTKDAGLIEYKGDYYYINDAGQAVADGKYDVIKHNNLKPAGTYRFDADAKMILTTELVEEEDGKLYYYIDGRLSDTADLIKYGEEYYWIQENGTALTDAKIEVGEGDLLDAGTYRVGEDAKVILTTEVVKEKDGKYYYYENGKLGKDAGLVAYDSAYYYITANGTAVTNKEMEVEKTNGLLPVGTYRFDKEGKADLATELVEGDDGKLYYYVNGALAEDAGLIEYEGDYYYITADGSAVTSTTMLVVKTNNLFPVDNYEFGEDGKMVIREGIYEGYYYEGGARTAAGLVKVGDDYYYADEGGKIVTDAKFDVVKHNDLLPEGLYRFDEEGKANLTTELVDEDGTLYYYDEGRLAVDEGLVKVEDDYYYIDENGAAVTDTMMLVEKTNDLLPEDTYCFGADGKMFERLAGDANADGVVEFADALLVLDYSSGADVEINFLNANVDGNDTVDLADALLLMQLSAGWEVELI